MTQAFIALLSGFAFTVFIMIAPAIGPLLAVLGIILAPFGYLITILAIRAGIESALAVIALHDRAARIQQPIPPINQTQIGAQPRPAITEERSDLT
jgi:hypothetical protein